MPSGPDDFLLSSLDIYLPSSGMEIYGMTNGSCPRVLRSQNSCRIFEYSGSYTSSDRGFAKHSATERKREREREREVGGDQSQHSTNLSTATLYPVQETLGRDRGHTTFFHSDTSHQITSSSLELWIRFRSDIGSKPVVW